MDKVDILGVKIDNLSFQEVLEKVKLFLGSKHQHFIVTANPEFIVAANQDEVFKEILNYADVAVADGVGLIHAAKWQGQRLQRVPGINLVWSICELAQEYDWPIYLLGGKEGIAKQATEVLTNNFPTLKIVGAKSGGYIADPTQPTIDIDININQTKPKILFVAFGQVKQEKWIFNNLDKIPSVKLAIGVGGSFDYISGTVPRAPEYLQRLGFEWLYRLIQEPKRWRRIYKATIVFSFLLIKKRLTPKRE